MKKLVLLITVLAVTMIAAQASAGTIILTQTEPKTYPQGTNDPCIFGYSGGTCVNPFGYNNTTVGNDTGTKAGGNYAPYTLTTQYTLAQMHQLLGGSNEFLLGYDVNEGGPVQVLAGFKIDAITGGTVTNLYSLPNPISLPLVQNGTGYADYLMMSATGGVPFSIAGLSEGTVIRFTYTMNVANDGGEQVWLIAQGTPPPVPEPATLLLFGTSMLGAVPMLRRRKK